MKISVCMIVLNEEDVIERVLTCAQKFADEIVLVDTGSCDLTLEKAKKFTDKIFNFKWNYDFSKARNYAFSKATCDYLFWLDADDFITDENVNKILKIKEEKELKDTYMFKYLCGFTRQNKPSLTFYRERLVRNCSLARFNGAVHEVIIPFGNITYTDIEIEHRKQRYLSNKRNLKIYEKMGNFKSFSTRDIYYFGKEYYYNGYYFSAIKVLKEHIKRQDCFMPDLKDSLITLYECAKILKYNNPQKYLLLAIEKVPLDAMLLCKLGDRFYAENQIEKAIKIYEFALNFSPSDVGFTYQEYYHLYPLLQLTKLYYEIGNENVSFFYHKRCLAQNPLDERVIFNEKFFNQLS